MDRLTSLAREALERWPAIESVGIGVPGLYDPATGTTRFLVNLPGDWAGRPVAATVAAAVDRPVTLINDARAFGLAELWLGAGRGARSMVGLTLGTGVGGVIVIDGRVHLGHDGTGGELGHQTIDPKRAIVRLRERRLPRGLRARRPVRGGMRNIDRGSGRGGCTRGGCDSLGRHRADRPLPRDRHRQHDRGRDPGSGRRRWRDRRRGRSPVGADPGRAAAARPYDQARCGRPGGRGARTVGGLDPAPPSTGRTRRPTGAARPGAAA